MTATPNDVRFANDVCLTAHWGKHRIIATIGSNIIMRSITSYRRKAMHHLTNSGFYDIIEVAGGML